MHASRIRTVALRGAAVITATLVLAAMVGTWGASTSEAASYRFWGYWLGGDSGWSFSSQGASRRPADGAVEGWRFAISEASSSTTPPRHSASFARLCGSTPPQEGKKRVGLVVDFGTTADAPRSETPPALIATCVVAPSDANGYAVLAAVVQLRVDAGLICGMDGYPAVECGAAVDDPTSSPSTAPTKGSGGGGGSQTESDGSGSESSSSPAQGASPAPGAAAGTGDQGDGPKQQKKSKSDGKAKKASSDVEDDDQPLAADQADATPAAATTAATASGSPSGLVAGVVIVGALLVAAVVARRRRT